ncbi:SDR family oxidoreductase [Pararhodobacter oceanensis]|uniref:Oxidoreductase n=1 Tax=Pararhodobacter oceanensis TaxID=2172121 RepID=A0A2T8HQ82_9RHOB|nr:SDR family oxidoreductase [Pararhodobacter oceanensis]PVH27565.1 oxidoreductase [Pararhodobacter oceanensis]
MQKAIVLGGYGLIGAASMRALRRAGFTVTGIGRSTSAALQSDPSADWLIRDIPAITIDEWRIHLAGVDVVVNASGALQDGARDDLTAIHVTALSRLTQAAAELPLRIVQISAAGVSAEASTAFFRSKAQGDAILCASALDWVVLRPTLVLAPDAYGGTALLRGASALPLLMPRIMPEAQVQTVYIGDLAEAVVAAAQGELPSRLICDLTEREARPFPELLQIIRCWQGWPAPRLHLRLPTPLITALGKAADVLGLLGWRSPLRSTALRALQDGITGNPDAWEDAGGRPCRSLAQTLALLPATRQERLFARSYFALPLAIATLALFWVFSGLITLFNPARAMAILSVRDVPNWTTNLSVFGGAVADLGLGFAILWRRWTRAAALGMLALSGAYLTGSLIVAPDLWADPLGPMLKVFPGMTLALMVWLMMEGR